MILAKLLSEYLRCGPPVHCESGGIVIEEDLRIERGVKKPSKTVLYLIEPEDACAVGCEIPQRGSRPYWSIAIGASSACAE